MSRWLPFPVVSLVLCALWLLLNQTAEPAHVLLGALMGIAVPLLGRKVQPLGYPRVRAPLVLARLLFMAAIEVLRSSVTVSRIILSGDYRRVNSQFILVPLTIRAPYGLALLSCLINMTPGTVWVEILPERYELVLHVFDLHDAQWWIDTIKTRYELPLIEIFESGGTHGGIS